MTLRILLVDVFQVYHLKKDVIQCVPTVADQEDIAKMISVTVCVEFHFFHINIATIVI